MRKNGLMITGLVLLVVIGGASLLAPFLSPFDPLEVRLNNRFAPPFQRPHLLGTDALGRDVLSRLLYGGRLSLLLAVLSTLITLSVGMLLGMLAGYFGGWVDGVVSFVVNTFLGIPDVVFTLALLGVLRPGFGTLLLALNAGSWVGLARVARGEVLFLRESGFVEGARAMGAGAWYCLLKHILPNLFPTMGVLGSLRFGGFVLELAALSYLGIGVQPPFPDWAVMLNDARPYLFAHPHLFIFPALIITVVILGANCLGEGLRDALDVRFQRGIGES
jgi:peptide/nickel transport system permease protein